MENTNSEFMDWPSERVYVPAHISDLKDFERLLKISRKYGVLEASVLGVSFKLGDMPVKSRAVEDQEIETDGLTEDELMFYHLQGSK